jgi:hypothetical protein
VDAKNGDISSLPAIAALIVVVVVLACSFYLFSLVISHARSACL